MANQTSVQPLLEKRLATRTLTAECGLPESEMTPFLDHLDTIAREKGFEKKQVTLVWRDVGVVGSSALISEGIPNFGKPFLGLLMLPLLPLLLVKRKIEARPQETVTSTAATLLHPTNGFVRPGEMLLVLGKPGSGADALVRVLGQTPQRVNRAYREVSGDITLNGMPNKEFKAQFRNEVLYSGDRDLHIPALTVRQTISSALQFKIGRTSSEEGADAVRDENASFYEDWLGLGEALDTVVGDEFLRGVSGGEKKRVSIAEQLLGSAAVNLWEQTTRGLDSTYALQVIKGIRMLTTKLKRTTVMHINQTGDSIFNLFDNVLLLSRGRTVYFGPTSKAQSYFERLGFRPLPRQSVSDFINSVTEIKERTLAGGVDPKGVPSTAEEFEAAWLSSEEYRNQMTELANCESSVVSDNVLENFVAAENAFRNEYHSSGSLSVFARTAGEQVKACLTREFLLLRGQLWTVVATILFEVVVGIIIGSINFRQPLNGQGAFSRAGIIFFSLLFNSLQASAEIPKLVTERPFTYKHKEWSFYHTGLHYFSWALADLPIRVIKTLLFGTIIYWLAGLNPNPLRFFTFLLFNFFSGFSYSSFSRFLTAVSSDAAMAIRLNALWLIPCLLYTGYLIPYPEVRPWFKWFPWINPLFYSFRALMANEYRDLVFKCTDDYVVPTYESAPAAFKTCNLAGAKPGSLEVGGGDYIAHAYSLDSSLAATWMNFGGVVGLWLLFLSLSVLIAEWLERGGSVGNRMIFQKLPKNHVSLSESGSRESLSLTIDDEKGTEFSRHDRLLTKVTSSKIAPNVNLTWKNLNYWVDSKSGGESQLLTNVTGCLRQGRMLALMGFSGAGKTTLQDVLTRRKVSGRTEGTVFVGPCQQTASFKRIMGYAEQMDILTPTMTVRESLRFSAYLRQPVDVSIDEKAKFVEEVIELMGLHEIADALVGRLETGVGINLTDRKRVAIAMELCARPELLVLDEPTSGLDTYAAFQIIRLLRKLAENGLAILCTIHQPSATLFEYFDDLLLLSSGGRTVYFGEIGPQSRTVTNYFERHGAAVFDPSENPAEYILDAGNGLRNEDVDALVDWVQLWNSSPEAQLVEDIVSQLRTAPANEKAKPGEELEYSVSTIQQIPIVTKHMFTTYWRKPDYNFGILVAIIFNCLYTSLTFFQVGNDRAGAVNRIFSIFMTACWTVVSINFPLPHFCDMKKNFLHESAQGFYNWFAFSTAISVVEIPFVVIRGTVFFLMYYYTTGLSGSSYAAATFWIFQVLAQLFGVTLSQAIGSITPDFRKAMIIISFIGSVIPGVAGLALPAPLMSPFFQFFYYLNYYVEATLTTEFRDLTIKCSDSEFLMFKPPPGNTCSAYMAPYFSGGGPGYLKDPTATDVCAFCQVSDPSSMLRQMFGFNYSNVALCATGLLAMCVFNRLVMFVALRYHARRSSKFQ
ncbi:hypothetical protein M427DRAFT_134928 [Gonapodya prolifera JEL478]|uniref:ABC transporter domain-containing protein n=1 Tax=Gonapodya prolifera (strain JEL478) TaxID=1344416 RepID=A0A139AFR4_GONPJ|nr:hypothetical protein M427DRAFT_134928 [Gonapodya prolifera JEL478]|eukprot:KXS15662.1 hypothetical protein M427DRAFT_134928 [Gonapodya prolifera JEL478]